MGLWRHSQHYLMNRDKMQGNRRGAGGEEPLPFHPTLFWLPVALFILNFLLPCCFIPSFSSVHSVSHLSKLNSLCIYKLMSSKMGESFSSHPIFFNCFLSWHLLRIHPREPQSLSSSTCFLCISLGALFIRLSHELQRVAVPC